MLGLKKSPWIIHYDASSCNGCDIETLACLSPVYDVERLGVVNTGNPKHADIFLVTGAVNEQNLDVLRNIYRQMPEPKVVVAVGVCACTGGIFRDCYNVAGGVDSLIPVDVYVPGCAARPEAIIDGVIRAVGVLHEKQSRVSAAAHNVDEIVIADAVPTDAGEVLALQKIAYQSEAEIYGDESLPALQQTQAELESDFQRMVFLKALVNGKVIGCIRGYQTNETAHILRLIVHPFFQGRGLGSRLVLAMEQRFPEARRFEAFTGHRSRRNLHLYNKLGYRAFDTRSASETLQWVYLQKARP